MTMHVVGTRPKTVPPSQSVVLRLSASFGRSLWGFFYDFDRADLPPLEVHYFGGTCHTRSLLVNVVFTQAPSEAKCSGGRNLCPAASQVSNASAGQEFRPPVKAI